MPHLIRRIICLCIGMFIMSIGIAFSITSDLGTSPVSSAPYVLSLFTPASLAITTIIVNAIIILLQIVILRKNFKLVKLIQVPVIILFGYLCDLGVWLLRGVSYNSYWQQWILCILGIVILAFGVSVEMISRISTLAGEGLALAISQVTGLKFGNAKVIVDVSLVVSAVVLSLIFSRSIQGVREGTVAAAVCVGLITKQYAKPLAKFEQKFLC